MDLSRGRPVDRAGLKIGKRVVVRPWLQYFDDYPWATKMRYDAPQIEAQMKAVADSNSFGWMLWIVREADNWLGHRSPRKFMGIPRNLIFCAVGRAINCAIGKDKDLTRIIPVDQAVAAVAPRDVFPN